MKKTLIALALILSFAVPSALAQEGLTVRSFQLRHKDAEKAAAVIKPLFSAQGSFSIQPSTNTLVVTDTAENLRKIAAAVESFDAPLRALRVELKLVAASRAAQTSIPAELKEIAAKLSGVLKFNAFEKVGELTAQGREGDSVVARIDGYRAEFRFGEYDPVNASVRLNDFQLSRVQGDQLVPVLKTALNLKIGQTVALGASRDPQSDRALMLVLVAQTE
jgi:hypothetical protein